MNIKTADVATYQAALGTSNRTRRGNPDVSAQGVNFYIVLGEANINLSLTEFANRQTRLPARAAAPRRSRTAEGPAHRGGEAIARLPQPLLLKRPWLHCATRSHHRGQPRLQHQARLGDVQFLTFFQIGFPAKAGWDSVTGLGTLNFALLKTAVGL